ncbi:hypothetical protein VU01_14202 [Candidatus Electrothrix marina]|uniref:Uncharacterized protein n=1 Tax=Candidatus Electrothrix marina TaxID=1859130 RepID=A0A444JA58_9BACT|nr:hypothetical protein VU01_14202 [Candidatus Electrothrix marina]
MSLIEKRELKRTALVQLANDMVNGKIHLIEGVRKICSLRHAVGDPDNDVFMPIRAIDSETDHFPLGTTRHHCAGEYLERIDMEMDFYLDDAKQDILNACNEIIKVFS